ncbi:MAG: TVP38/TMEM64 family protein [Nitriliruptoraceae bacterium]
MTVDQPVGEFRSTLVTWLVHPVFRLAVLAALVASAAVIATRSDVAGVESLRAAFDGLGWIGPAVFVLTYTVAATIMLPAAPFTIGAGLLFGPLVGTVTALIGATTGATGAFFVGRLLGRGAVERFGGRRFAALDRHLDRRGFSALLVVRLVPLFPFNLLNVAAGVTGIRVRDYVLATAVGIFPGTFAYAAVGGTIDDPTSPAFAAAVGVFLVVTGAAVVASRRMRANDAKLADEKSLPVAAVSGERS